MNKSQQTVGANKNQTKQPHYFKKRIGSTNYKVAIYQSDTATERIEDKILRLVRNDVCGIMEVPQTQTGWLSGGSS